MRSAITENSKWGGRVGNKAAFQKYRVQIKLSTVKVSRGGGMKEKKEPHPFCHCSTQQEAPSLSQVRC